MGVKDPRIVLNAVEFGPREFAVAEMVGEGCPLKEIAARLKLSEGTVKVYLSKIYAKMQAQHPEIRQSDRRLLLAQWMRCYKCGAFRDPGGGI